MAITLNSIVMERNSGLDPIGEILWGGHFCQLYQSREELPELLVPDLQAGPVNNEFCLWPAWAAYERVTDDIVGGESMLTLYSDGEA